MKAFLLHLLLPCVVMYYVNCLPYRNQWSKYETQHDYYEDYYTRKVPRLRTSSNNVRDFHINQLSWFPVNDLRARQDNVRVGESDEEPAKPETQTWQVAVDASDDCDDSHPCDSQANPKTKQVKTKDKIKKTFKCISGNFNMTRNWSAIKNKSSKSMKKVGTYVKKINGKLIVKKLKNVTNPLRVKSSGLSTKQNKTINCSCDSCNDSTTPPPNHCHPKSSHVEKIKDTSGSCASKSSVTTPARSATTTCAPTLSEDQTMSAPILPNYLHINNFMPVLPRPPVLSAYPLDISMPVKSPMPDFLPFSIDSQNRQQPGNPMFQPVPIVDQESFWRSKSKKIPYPVQKAPVNVTPVPSCQCLTTPVPQVCQTAPCPTTPSPCVCPTTPPPHVCPTTPCPTTPVPCVCPTAPVPQVCPTTPCPTTPAPCVYAPAPAPQICPTTPAPQVCPTTPCPTTPAPCVCPTAPPPQVCPTTPCPTTPAPHVCPTTPCPTTPAPCVCPTTPAPHVCHTTPAPCVCPTPPPQCMCPTPKPTLPPTPYVCQPPPPCEPPPQPTCVTQAPANCIPQYPPPPPAQFPPPAPAQFPPVHPVQTPAPSCSSVSVGGSSEVKNHSKPKFLSVFPSYQKSMSASPKFVHPFKKGNVYGAQFKKAYKKITSPSIPPHFRQFPPEMSPLDLLHYISYPPSCRCKLSKLLEQLPLLPTEAPLFPVETPDPPEPSESPELSVKECAKSFPHPPFHRKFYNAFNSKQLHPFPLHQYYAKRLPLMSVTHKSSQYVRNFLSPQRLVNKLPSSYADANHKPNVLLPPDEYLNELNNMVKSFCRGNKSKKSKIVERSVNAEGENANSSKVLETAGEMASDLAGRVTSLWHCVLGSHRVPETRDVRFYLYTRRNVIQPELLTVNYDLINKKIQEQPQRYDIDCFDLQPNEIEDFQRISDENREIVKSNYLNIRAPTKILIHGYTGSYKDSRMAKIKDAYLNRGRYNVIQVDWEMLAAPPCYVRVTHNSKFVGETIAQLLNGLHMVGLNMSLVHLVGFSLGAQVAGFAGNNSTTVPLCRITGLDPALPLFLHTRPSGHLDRFDAKFVDVIHTCGGILAMLDPLGHVDFYPNGGTRQPGCEFSNLKCSHSRAPQLFAESVDSNKKFRGQLCLTWEDYIGGDCDNTSATSYMGEPCSRSSVSGKYYLLTGSKEPFAL
ncbi:hypothetical protein RUM43_009919 [Polyplax serrata]|uniref:Lipase domain-containing protein n=1 Tax=Polyplax serrata TaxID=468196 RepID=A0AAN8P7Z8_POLSC